MFVELELNVESESKFKDFTISRFYLNMLCDKKYFKLSVK